MIPRSPPFIIFLTSSAALSAARTEEATTRIRSGTVDMFVVDELLIRYSEENNLKSVILATASALS